MPRCFYDPFEPFYGCLDAIKDHLTASSEGKLRLSLSGFVWHAYIMVFASVCFLERSVFQGIAHVTPIALVEYLL